MILDKFTKQPADVQVYGISFVDWLDGFGDTGLSIDVTVDEGLTKLAFQLVSGVAKVWVSGGSDGESYKVTVTLTTTGGRVKQDEILIRVKET
jgi:hypothetical protein